VREGAENLSRISRRTFLAGIVAGAAAAIYSLIEAHRIIVTRLRLGLGAKTAFLVDTHIHGMGSVEKQVLEILREERPRIILHGGDVIDELTGSLDQVKLYLSSMEADEKYAVLGNHDYWCGRTRKLMQILEECGFKVLRDEVVESEIGRILGVDWRDDRRYASGVRRADIILAHDPNVALYAHDAGIILAGHTHGGVMFGPSTILTNSAYTRGLYDLGDTLLYVSRGLGSIIPLRPTSPLELVILD
jgi:predicted MPP superfamily phosphohydrolase